MHIEHLYSATSWKLVSDTPDHLFLAPDSSTAKKVRKGHKREGPGKEVKLQRDPISGQLVSLAILHLFLVI